MITETLKIISIEEPETELNTGKQKQKQPRYENLKSGKDYISCSKNEWKGINLNSSY